MDGIDFCQHIRQQDKQIPLFIISAFGESDKLQQCTELNIEFLSKPISFQALKQAMDALGTVLK